MKKKKIKGRWRGKTKGKSAKTQKGAKVKIQKLGGTQGRILNISKSICKDNSYTRDSIIKRVQEKGLDFFSQFLSPCCYKLAGKMCKQRPFFSTS